MDATQIGTLIVALTGLVTALTAIYKNRTDTKHKKREHEVAATTAFDDRHQVIYTTIQGNIVDPLNARVLELSEDNQRLRSDLDAKRKDLALTESKYQIAILYVRELLAHIKQMSYPGDPPAPPSGLEV